jgi:deoxycytidine triphosphate deaminase
VGGILCGTALMNAIGDGRVFAPDSVRPDHVKSSSYDVTISRQNLVVYRAASSEPEQYRSTEFPQECLVLKPGDSAIVSSHEIMQLDWGICGLLGQRFGLAQQGLIVHTGLMVDPGYGFRSDPETGDWAPSSPGTTLKFIVQNAGSEDAILRLGEQRIARLALFALDEPVEKAPVDEPYLARLGADATLPQAKGLTYYSHWRPHFDTLEKRLDEAKLREQALRLEEVERSNNTVVLFGIYLIAATLLGVSFTVGVSVARDIFSSEDSNWLGAAAIFAILLWVGAQFAVTWAVLQAFRRTDPS